MDSAGLMDDLVVADVNSNVRRSASVRIAFHMSRRSVIDQDVPRLGLCERVVSNVGTCLRFHRPGISSDLVSEMIEDPVYESGAVTPTLPGSRASSVSTAPDIRDLPDPGLRVLDQLCGICISINLVILIRSRGESTE